MSSSSGRTTTSSTEASASTTTTRSGSSAGRVLVTGGAGAIGSTLVEALLARGDEVAVLDSFHDFYPRAQKERNLARARGARGFAGVFEGDIRDVEFVAKTFESFAPRAVVHLAARAGVRPSLEDPVTYSDVNLLGTQVGLNAAPGRRLAPLRV